MLEIFSRGSEPEVEEDDSRVVDAVGKRETAMNLKRQRRWSANVVTPYKKCIPGHGSTNASSACVLPFHPVNPRLN